jgi:hypothetical protein
MSSLLRKLIACVFDKQSWFGSADLLFLPLPIVIINLIQEYAEPVRVKHVCLSGKDQLRMAKKEWSNYLFLFERGKSFYIRKHQSETMQPFMAIPSVMARDNSPFLALIQTSCDFLPFEYFEDGRQKARRCVRRSELRDMVMDPIYLKLLANSVQRHCEDPGLFDRVAVRDLRFAIDILELRTLFTFYELRARNKLLSNATETSSEDESSDSS